MMILPEKKLCFIHVPKTGGTSFTKALAPFTDPRFRSKNPKTIGLGHQGTWHLNKSQHAKFKDPEKDFPKALQNEFNDYTFVTICRNPYEWLASNYLEFYSQDRGNAAGQNFIFGQVFPERSLSDFYEFFRRFHRGYPGFYGITPQSSFVVGVPKDRLEFIRFEHLDADTADFLARHDVPFEALEHKLDRGSGKRERLAKIAGSDEHIAFCNDHLKSDFELFGYECA